MKALARLAVTAGIIAMSIGAIAGTIGATAASAGTGGPLPVVSMNTNGWHGKVRPHHIYIGQGGAPLVRSLRWTHWSPYTAHSAGRLIQQLPGCTVPSYECPTSSNYVSVRLWGPASHDGRVFFTRMRWAWHDASGIREVLRWRFIHGYWTCPQRSCWS